ncbi:MULTISPECIES: DUF5687 family protein [Sphingobacterium]|uniref:DUF5687 family protein n=1 Tax=Sphingobacterium populi TaxID=1812824 RepID=A0ABW5UHK3_9SPHI|nr:DUF5687 family protein [Sphingobacterium sp. CFCC 11742]
MFVKFLVLEWKSLFRSAHRGHSISIKILLAVFALLIARGIWSAGYYLYDLLDESSANLFPMQQVNRYLLFWFLGELVLRFVMQQLPVINVKPFLIQRISRDNISHYLLSKSIFSFYNLLSPLLFIPFAVACWSVGDYRFSTLLAWLIAIIGTSWSLHFFNFSLQHIVSANWRLTSIVILVFAFVFFLDYLHIFSATGMVAGYFELVLQYPFSSCVPIVLLVFAYVLIHRSLRRRLYLESNTQQKKNRVASDNFRWMNLFGRYKPLIRLDFKLVWRNKRTRSLLVISTYGLFYGLLFYNNSSIQNQSLLVFIGIFTTGLFTFNFGQFLPAWDSSYYPFIQTQRIAIKDYLNAKCILLYGSIFLTTILTIPYVYLGTDILLINAVTAIYNIGINVPLLLYFGTYNNKRVDLDKSQFFNYQGMGAAQWIVMLPAIIIPILLWAIIHAFANFEISCLLLAAIGIVGFCLRQFFIQRIAQRYQARKYNMLEGFKQVSE